ncbi:hypothetical protein GGF41_005583 [Coemansia sp. RSA 2531]|nr:hypothetical protein GGI14_003144 [Coemansia sp. S680]KAJ2415770.1 hypothetical protein GGF41_005583 [Coemansia sp. RSA 2531]
MLAATHILALLASIALATQGVLGMYDKGSAVKKLHAGNFDRVLDKTSQPTFVKFLAPWCGYCKSLEPEYEKAARRAQGVGKFYAVDCDEDKNRGLCARFNVKGFPTLKVFTEKRTKRGNRRSVDYQGERTAGAMVKFARTLLPSLSKKLSSAELDAFVTDSEVQQPKAVLLTDLRKASDLWKGISAQFDRRVQFAHVSSPDKDTLGRLGVSKLPAIIVFPTLQRADLFEVYKGEAKYVPLVKFIASTALAKKSEAQAASTHDEL